MGEIVRQIVLFKPFKATDQKEDSEFKRTYLYEEDAVGVLAHLQGC